MLRAAKKRLAMRSSSEWKVTTASLPLGLSRCSAALMPRASSSKLLIEIKTERLKGPRRRVFGIVMPAAKHAGDDVGKLAGARDRLFRPAGSNGAGDGAGALLLAERGDDGGKVAFGERVDEVACGRAFGAHAHVERAVLAEREAALGLIELHGGDAEVEGNPVDRGDAFAFGDLAHLGIAAEDEFQASGETSDSSASA